MSDTHYTPIKSGSKTLGIVAGEELRKSLYGSKHFLRKPQAICIDCGTLDQAEALGAKRVRVVDQETGIVYSATIEHIRHAGIIIDRGWGTQLALSMNGWTKSSRGGVNPHQLSFFGEAVR